MEPRSGRLRIATPALAVLALAAAALTTAVGCSPSVVYDRDGDGDSVAQALPAPPRPRTDAGTGTAGFGGVNAYASSQGSDGGIVVVPAPVGPTPGASPYASPSPYGQPDDPYAAPGGYAPPQAQQPYPPQAGTAPASNDPLEPARAYCVQRINQYRASLGLPALQRVAAAESCLDRQAAADGQSGRAHGAFGQCGEAAQNECPGWPGQLGQVLPGCLDMMWREGPGGGHYDTMASPTYRYVACGFSQLPDGSWWAVQDFR